jgi:hypothetical protein
MGEHMDIRALEALERSYQNAKTNRGLGACIGGFGFLGLLASLIWGVANPVIMGIVFGGGLVFCLMCHDKVTKTIRALDLECYSKFKKSYAQSYRDIFDIKHPRT